MSDIWSGYADMWVRILPTNKYPSGLESCPHPRPWADSDTRIRTQRVFFACGHFMPIAIFSRCPCNWRSPLLAPHGWSSLGRPPRPVLWLYGWRGVEDNPNVYVPHVSEEKRGGKSILDHTKIQRPLGGSKPIESKPRSIKYVQNKTYQATSNCNVISPNMWFLMTYLQTL
jgi:hypothetical protein